jgi:DNA-binding transcriptional MerR regulator
MHDDGPLLTIGELASRAGLPVRTIRFWSDAGVLPPAGRTGSGRRLYDAACLARLELIVTLRELGLGLADVRRVLDARASVAEVAAVHLDALDALDAQIRTLRLQRAVLAAVVKRAADGKEMIVMNKLARLSAAERRQIIDDFTAEVFGGLDPGPAGAARWIGAASLPDNPSAEQVDAWVEVAELASNPDFRRRLRQLTEIGIQYQAGHGLVDAEWAQDNAGAALSRGVPPDSAEAGRVIDRILGGPGSPGRAELLAQLEVFTDPRIERYWQLPATINGREPFTSPIPALGWLAAALRARPKPPQ